VTDEGFNPKGMNFIAAEAHLQMSRSEVKPGDLLMTITGNIGRVAKASGQFPTANINQHIARIRVLSDGRADVDFIYQCLKHEGYATYYRAILTGQAYPQISLQQVRGTPVALPPLPEQQKIAAILTTVDDKLDVIARQIDATQTLKQGLMQTLFSRGVGTQDVSGRWVPHTEFKESELGVIPVGWNFHRLDDLAHKITDGTHKTPSYTTQGIPFLRVTDIKGGDINFSNIKFISENEHLELIKRCKPEKGDVLLSKNGTIGIAREVDWSFEFSIFVSLCLIKVKPLLLSRYLTNLFEADLIKRQIKNQSKQGAVTNLHLEEIRKFQIPLPPVAEQQKIVDILDVVDARFAGLLAKQVQYQTLKRGLMQKLLTGEWRVSLGTHQDTAIAA
jgi:type I restriction enzyme S subunit